MRRGTGSRSREGVGRGTTFLQLLYSFIHSQMFLEYLLCARHYDRCWVNKCEQNRCNSYLQVSAYICFAWLGTVSRERVDGKTGPGTFGYREGSA